MHANHRPHSLRSRRGSRGFSLIELAVTITMVAVSLLGATAAVVSGASLVDQTSRLRAASRSASGIMEQIRATPFEDLPTTWHDTQHQIDGLAAAGGAGVASVNVREIDNGSVRWRLYEVTVNVRFAGASGDQIMPIITYVSDRTEGGSLSSSISVSAAPEPDPNADPTPTVEPDPQPDPDPTPDPTPDPYPDPTPDPTPDPAPAPGNSGNGHGKGKKK